MIVYLPILLYTLESIRTSGAQKHVLKIHVEDLTTHGPGKRFCSTPPAGFIAHVEVQPWRGSPVSLRRALRKPTGAALIHYGESNPPARRAWHISGPLVLKQNPLSLIIKRTALAALRKTKIRNDLEPR